MHNMRAMLFKQFGVFLSNSQDVFLRYIFFKTVPTSIGLQSAVSLSLNMIKFLCLIVKYEVNLWYTNCSSGIVFPQNRKEMIMKSFLKAIFVYLELPIEIILLSITLMERSQHSKMLVFFFEVMELIWTITDSWFYRLVYE